MPQKTDREDNEDFDLRTLRSKLRNVSSEILDRDLSEMSQEIEFLEEQVRADLTDYLPADIERATEKITHLKSKADVFKIELDKRSAK
jgi:hypothetical protein